MISPTLKFGRLSALATFLSSLALGCVITLGENGKSADDCPDPNSTLSDGKCFCKAFYDWCNPDDNADLTCCESDNTNSNSNSNSNSGTTSGSATDSGTTADVLTGGTTSEVPTTSESGTTGEPLDCSVSTEPPASCNANTENFLCISADNAACDVEGNKYYVCTNGAWVENTSDGNASCKADGYDFSFGCNDNGSSIDFVCGTGPGTACTTGESTCGTDIQLDACVLGKQTATDCTLFCMQEGMDGVTYDYGFCGDQRGISCICCDEGEDGCPINEGGTSTGGGTTSGGSDSSG